MALTELLAYLLAAVIAVPVARRLGFGSVLGYLAAGLGRFGQVVARVPNMRGIPFFVVAIEDVEDSVRTVELVKRHFPQLKVFARATDRAHARALQNRHVDYVIRENYVSSLEMAERLLTALGDSPARAGDSIRQFRKFDEQLLERERAVDQDEGRLVQTIREAERELAFLFHSDVKDAEAVSGEAKS